MPVITFDLVDGLYSDEQMERLLKASSQYFAAVLECPVERIRAFIRLHRPQLCAVGGELVSQSGVRAPMFSVIVLEGRPVEQRQRLLAGLTDLVVEMLGVPRDGVRGAALPVHPENWAIAGQPASVKRASEVSAREAQALNPI